MVDNMMDYFLHQIIWNLRLEKMSSKFGVYGFGVYKFPVFSEC
jgi:hypothetical protein